MNLCRRLKHPMTNPLCCCQMSNEAGELLLRPLIEDAHEVIPRNQVDFSWPTNVELLQVFMTRLTIPCCSYSASDCTISVFDS